MSNYHLAAACLMTSVLGCAEPAREPASPATSSAPPSVASSLGPQPTSPLPGAIAGFRFGMTPVEFAAHCKSVGTPNPLTGNDHEVRLHTCDAVEVEPGMRLNIFLGFCEGDSRLCEINYWTNRNAGKAFPILATK